MKVADVMTSPVHSVSLGKSVWYASQLMSELKIGSLVVVEAREVVGIITSRDVRTAHPNRIVADAMTPNPICVPEHVFVWDALLLMEQNRIERLIVLRQGELVGIVTRESLTTRLSEWYDSLTQLYGSSYIHVIGEELLASGRSFQLLFIDLNRFGEVNKRFGHPVGDDMIREFSNKLKSLFGPGDYISRYAGDEFAIITQKSDEEVQRIIDQLSCGQSVGRASVSADTGWVNERVVPEFGQMTFRELISKASMLSTQAKIDYAGRR
ncbi:Diguanylate cyclase DosC [Chlamydia abortus]|nr:Diguanylate cyclase DosC [Chlamydia abortus]